MGERVRYDGGHKREPFLVSLFGPGAEWVTACPEVEIGMGTPREPLQLERRDGHLRMFTVHSRIDYTDAMNAWSQDRLTSLKRLGLDGYVLKSKSPSCGKEGVPVVGEDGATLTARGIFAEALIAAMPTLPIEDEARLRDPGLRDRFVARVLEYHRSKNHNP
jgi:uncharacterized protein YbbK (DUF523 family)